MSDQINWLGDYQAGLEQAQADNKLLLLELYMDGCPHCARLHKETHGDPQVIQEINKRFIPVRLEGRSYMDVVNQFEVKGAPTTLILSSQGQEQRRIVGFHTPSDYLKELAAVA
ncbi:MAG: thioredoxin family protein [Deltaproteobacteria bacterium]|nr:thioredoxin family protein [Deltaproteobacteria bacterium]MBW1952516.1 thioredoxin family protein [Deltaproteobacteria bacterium]MBW1987277.1 thioredoxin family protein [Deltaproteobacteria bacterium]MBW2135135.1 thioredoxin family protein [Deltaproteobacteria bacterium]